MSDQTFPSEPQGPQQEEDDRPTTEELRRRVGDLSEMVREHLERE